jgi:hypothetical protein
MECQGVDIPAPGDGASGASGANGSAAGMTAYANYANAGEGASGASAGASGNAAPPNAGSGGNAAPATAAHGGMLTLTYTPTLPVGVTKGWWDSADGTLKPTFGVIWIEDPMGRFVKTLEFWGMTIYIQANLHDYLLKRTYCPIDTVSQATRFDYSQHMTTWDGTSSKGFVVPDGPYVLWIDIQMDERNPMPSYRIDFMKGDKPFTITPPPVPPQTGTTLTYTPN